MIRYTKALSKLTGKGAVTMLLGGRPVVVTTSHPNYSDIVDELGRGEQASVAVIRELVDVGNAIVRTLRSHNRKVGYANGRITFRGEAIDEVLSNHIVRMMREGDRSFGSFVKALENIARNPSPESREHLFTWMKNGDVTFNENGEIVAYKGVHNAPDNRSIYRGSASVDGLLVSGQIPNPVGAVVTMPRDDVNPDRDNGCSTGLHVGTFKFASGYGSKLLTVAVNPMDVVAVPRDASFHKMRVCRYRVLAATPLRVTTPTVYSGTDPIDDPGDECCGHCDEDCYNNWCDGEYCGG